MFAVASKRVRPLGHNQQGPLQNIEIPDRRGKHLAAVLGSHGLIQHKRLCFVQEVVNLDVAESFIGHGPQR